MDEPDIESVALERSRLPADDETGTLEQPEYHRLREHTRYLGDRFPTC